MIFLLPVALSMFTEALAMIQFNVRYNAIKLKCELEFFKDQRLVNQGDFPHQIRRVVFYLCVSDALLQSKLSIPKDENLHLRIGSLPDIQTILYPTLNNNFIYMYYIKPDLLALFTYKFERFLIRLSGFIDASRFGLLSGFSESKFKDAVPLHTILIASDEIHAFITFKKLSENSFEIVYLLRASGNKGMGELLISSATKKIKEMTSAPRIEISLSTYGQENLEPLGIYYRSLGFTCEYIDKDKINYKCKKVVLNK